MAVTPSDWLLLLCFHAASSGLEAASFARSEAMSNHMGLFLQKTNIIRDYLVRVKGPGRERERKKGRRVDIEKRMGRRSS